MTIRNPWWCVHNLVAHPMLVLYPRLGEWLHEYTAKRMDGKDGLLLRVEAGPYPVQQVQGRPVRCN